ncbi:hypothetical protein BC828DRAFT_387408 [Blastocladiella britannica]|nr:hypothetical protein BC828DRAFT_387408 [Blastocladiella britannica]
MSNPLVYDVLAYLLSFIVGIFFREIKARGAQNIPKYGPVIFVAAPHHNQFVDPIMLIKTAMRRVGFLSAQKSMDKKFVGAFARGFGAIGVTRTQDIAVKIPGALHLADPANAPDTLHVVGGKGDLAALIAKGAIAPGHSLLFSVPLHAGGKGGDVSMEVAAVPSPTTITLKRAVTDQELASLLSQPAGFPAKVSPKVDFSKMYESVYERLNDGRCIGIFPEGGSHDRSELLPFKAGVAMMALGAMAKFPGLDVKLVPVGLSYFHADRFRSRAVVEYGAPITIPKELVEQYKVGGDHKRNACKAVLDVVQAAVANVTVTAPDYGTLMVVQAVRRLYRPLNRKLTLVQKLELTRRLMKGYTQYKDDPRVKDLEQKVLYYNQLLQYYGLQDHQVERTAIGGVRALGLLLKRLCLLIIMGIVALPGTVLNAPVALAASRISAQKAKEALAASTVKIEGRDVLATWKVMVTAVLVPLLYVAYTFLAWVGVRFIFAMERPWTWLIPFCVFSALPYLSLVALSWGETGADIYRSLAPLTFAILPTRWQSSHNLRQVRSQLARDINDVINSIGPLTFPDFNQFFLRDAEIAPTQQSQAGLHRVSSWVSSWLVSQGVAPGSKSGVNIALDLDKTSSGKSTANLAAAAAFAAVADAAAAGPVPPLPTLSTMSLGSSSSIQGTASELAVHDLTRYFVAPMASPTTSSHMEFNLGGSGGSPLISRSGSPVASRRSGSVSSMTSNGGGGRTRVVVVAASPSSTAATSGSSPADAAVSPSRTHHHRSGSSPLATRDNGSEEENDDDDDEDDEDDGIVVIKAADVMKGVSAGGLTERKPAASSTAAVVVGQDQ